MDWKKAGPPHYMSLIEQVVMLVVAFGYVAWQWYFKPTGLADWVGLGVVCAFLIGLGIVQWQRRREAERKR